MSAFAKKKKKFCVVFSVYLHALFRVYANIRSNDQNFFFPAHICANMSCAFLIFATQFLIFAAKKGAKGAKKTKKKIESCETSLAKKNTRRTAYICTSTSVQIYAKNDIKFFFCESTLIAVKFRPQPKTVLFQLSTKFQRD